MNWLRNWRLRKEAEKGLVERHMLRIVEELADAEKLVITSGNGIFRRMVRDNCDSKCPCMCHDTSGGIHGHPYVPCYGKLTWPITWQGRILEFTVN